jgi:hypothetical protein
MPRGAEMSLAINEPEHVALYSNSNTTSEHALQMEKKFLILYACKTTKRGPTPNEKTHLAKG